MKRLRERGLEQGLSAQPSEGTDPNKHSGLGFIASRAVILSFSFV